MQMPLHDEITQSLTRLHVLLIALGYFDEGVIGPLTFEMDDFDTTLLLDAREDESGWPLNQKPQTSSELEDRRDQNVQGLQ